MNEKGFRVRFRFRFRVRVGVRNLENWKKSGNPKVFWRVVKTKHICLEKAWNFWRLLFANETFIVSYLNKLPKIKTL